MRSRLRMDSVFPGSLSLNWKIMGFDELPGIPEVWLKFMRGQLPALQPVRSVDELAVSAERILGGTPEHFDLIQVLAGRSVEDRQVLQNIQRLKQPGSLVILIQLSAGLFGGPAAQVLKCLTGIKLCEQLQTHSVNAVPIVWINPGPPPDFSGWAVNLVDDDGQIHNLGVVPGETVPDAVRSRLAQISEIGQGLFDPEVLDILKTAFVPGRSFASATAHFFSALMSDWEMVVLDPAAAPLQPAVNRAPARIRPPAGPFPDERITRELAMSAALPVLARVVDPAEAGSLVALPDFEEFGLPRLMAWPRVSATIGDIKSRRTLDRYHLNISQLYSGVEGVLASFADEIPRVGLQKLDDAGSMVEEAILEIKSLVPGGGRVLKAAEDCREKVCYQLKKVRDNFEASLNSRVRIAGRRVRRACNLLAPNQRLQETELAAVQIPLRYSRAGLRTLYEQMDIMNFEHQLIWMG